MAVAAPLRAQQPHRTAGEATDADIRYALGDTAFGWMTYRSDGSARSDSARRCIEIYLTPPERTRPAEMLTAVLIPVR